MKPTNAELAVLISALHNRAANARKLVHQLDAPTLHRMLNDHADLMVQAAQTLERTMEATPDGTHS